MTLHAYSNVAVYLQYAVKNGEQKSETSALERPYTHTSYAYLGTAGKPASLFAVLGAAAYVWGSLTQHLSTHHLQHSTQVPPDKLTATVFLQNCKPKGLYTTASPMVRHQRAVLHYCQSSILPLASPCSVSSSA